MALGVKRRQLRIQALETAAQYIKSMESGGASPEELVEDPDDLELFIEECEKLADKLEAMAEKLQIKI
ncbi:hypothetical protein [Vibrio agarivorans]|uniref:hypothetical protein n=1 Tax=Vibrio agarivorans TaxID=153622 RepID=UPI0025B29EE1|nr:hypothetical protein [Vibrio agarivorans]MDN3661159.1 hypothetical protein [Vibrio agarivorans]